MRIIIRDEPRDIDVVTVAIVENYSDNFKMFNCPTCKNPLFQYKGRLVAVVPGYAPVEVPVLLQCSNTNCRQKYLLKTILSRQSLIEKVL